MQHIHDFPYHAGEVRVQEAVLGVAAAAAHRDSTGSFIRPSMPAEHADFFADAPFLIASSLDADGWPRASILHGGPGRAIFADADRGRTFALAADAAIRGDAFEDNVRGEGKAVGILGIELATRRRNRVNGWTTFAETPPAETRRAGVRVRVSHSFGNCPKYIQARHVAERAPDELEPYSRTELPSAQLLDAARALFASADTLFIATGSASAGVDVSHRGGPAGFVRVEAAAAGDGAGVELRMPDYQGNNFFNSLGNIALEPRVGLLLVDFETGRVAQLRGLAAVELRADAALPGSVRVLSIRLSAIAITRGALRLLARGAPSLSPFNPPTRADEGDALTLVSARDESASMRTLEFALARPVRYRAGQYGSFLVSQPGAAAEPLARAWTLSSCPSGPFGDQRIEISVKRKPGGAASALLHAPLEVLRALDFRLCGIGGEFTLPLDAEPGRTLVLAAAGSGVTPAISMLRALARAELAARAEPSAPVRVALIYVVRSAEELAFGAEIASRASESVRVAVGFTRATSAAAAEAELGPLKSAWVRAFAGRLPARADLDAVLPAGADIARVYACGPGTFSADVRALLVSAGRWQREVITESFAY